MGVAMTVERKPDTEGPAAPAPAARSNVGLFIVFGLAAVVLLAAVAYSLMMVSGPMPGMNH